MDSVEEAYFIHRIHRNDDTIVTYAGRAIESERAARECPLMIYMWRMGKKEEGQGGGELRRKANTGKCYSHTYTHPYINTIRAHK